MATTLTIDMDDKSGPGFAALISRFMKSQEASEGLADGMEGVADQVERVSPELQQLAAIHAELVKQSEGVRQSQEGAIATFKAGSDAAASFGKATENVSRGASEAIKVYGEWQVAKAAVTNRVAIYETAVKAARATQAAFMNAVSTTGAYLIRHAEAVDAAAVRFLSMDSAAKQTLKTLSGLGSYVLGAKIAYEGFMAVAARTGVEVEKNGEYFVFLNEATEDQVIAFQALEREAKEMGRTLDNQLRIAGKSYSDFGLSVTSNADRINAAWGKLGDEIAMPFRDVINMTRDWWNETSILADAWKSFDRNFTGRVENMVENIGHLTTGVREARVAFLNIWDTKLGDEYARELDLLKQMKEATDKLAAANEKNRPDFASLRAYNDQLERSAEWEEKIAAIRGKAPIGGFKPWDLNKEQADIDRLKREEMQRAGDAAQAGTYETKYVKDAEGKNTSEVEIEGYDKQHEKLMEVIHQREKALKDRRERDHSEGIQRLLKEQEEQRKIGNVQQDLADRIAANRKQAALEQARLEKKLSEDFYGNELPELLAKIGHRYSENAELSQDLTEKMMDAATLAAEEELRHRIEASREEFDKRQELSELQIQRESASWKKYHDERIHDAVEASRKQYEESQKAVKDALKKQTDEEAKEIETRIAIYRDGVKRRLKEEEEATKAAKQRMADLSKLFEGGTRLADVKSQALQLEQSTQQQIAQIRMQAMQQYVQGDVKGFLESRQKALEIEQQFQKARKDLQDKFAKEGNALDKIKASIPDKNILEQIEKNRIDKIRKDREKDRPDPFENDDVVDPREARIRARYDRETKRQEDIARRNLRRDMRQGNVGEEEVSKATNDLTSKVLDSTKQTGEVGKAVVEGLRAQMKAHEAAIDRDKKIQEAVTDLTDKVEELAAMNGPDTMGEARGRSRRYGK